MQTPKVGEKLMKLPGTSTVFGKLRAALQSTGAFSVGSEQAESVSAYETRELCRASLSAECAKAAAEELAHNLRRRLM
jgi:hypothetical protein